MDEMAGSEDATSRSPMTTGDPPYVDDRSHERFLASLASQSLGIRREQASRLAKRYLQAHGPEDTAGFIGWIVNDPR